MTRDDDVAAVARAVAERLAPELDGRLPLEVERRLHESGDGNGAPERYIDPMSIAGLVVSIASLALAVYQELRRHTDAPQTEVVGRRVRIEVGDLPGIAALPKADRDHVVTVVVEETVRRSASGGGM